MNYAFFIIVNIGKTAAIANDGAIRAENDYKTYRQRRGGCVRKQNVLQRRKRQLLYGLRLQSASRAIRITGVRGTTFGYSIWFITHVLDLHVRRLSFEPHVHTLARVRPANIICAKCARPIRKPRANTSRRRVKYIRHYRVQEVCTVNTDCIPCTP